MYITTYLGLGCLVATGCMLVIYLNTGWGFDILFFNLGGAAIAFLFSSVIIDYKHSPKRKEKNETN